MVKVIFSRRRSEGKALSLGQSVRSSASTVRYPHEEDFVSCLYDLQKEMLGRMMCYSVTFSYS